MQYHKVYIYPVSVKKESTIVFKSVFYHCTAPSELWLRSISTVYTRLEQELLMSCGKTPDV